MKYVGWEYTEPGGGDAYKYLFLDRFWGLKFKSKLKFLAIIS